jgi:hypothetical protein
MQRNLLRQIRVLQIYAVFLTIALLVLTVLFLRQSGGRQHFKEVDAERLNIVEGDGTLRMVISNSKRQHPGAINGKNLPSRERPAGMLFFNDEGDECGGLIYDGNKKEAGFYYSIDQYKNDQIMQWQYAQDNGSTAGKDNGASQRVRSYGLKMWDRRDDFGLDDLLRSVDSLEKLKDTAAYAAGIKKMRAAGLLSTERLFLGKTRTREFGLFIRDDKGRPRIEIGLDSANNVVMHALDTSGHTIPFTR